MSFRQTLHPSWPWSLEPPPLVEPPYRRQTAGGLLGSLLGDPPSILRCKLRPLEGVKVVELSAAVAGQSCGVTLSEHGASVISIEPPDGDSLRWLAAGLATQTNSEADSSGAARSLGSAPSDSFTRGEFAPSLTSASGAGVSCIESPHQGNQTDLLGARFRGSTRNLSAEPVRRAFDSSYAERPLQPAISSAAGCHVESAQFYAVNRGKILPLRSEADLDGGYASARQVLTLCMQ
jgi:hypothetical protein